MHVPLNSPPLAISDVRVELGTQEDACISKVNLIRAMQFVDVFLAG